MVWYGGFVALAMKAYKLFAEAYSIDNALEKLLLALVGGVLIGLLKTKYIFIRSCQKNLKRIASLADPKIWEFYPIP